MLRLKPSRATACALLVLCSLLGGDAWATESNERKPDILFILLDDLRRDALSFLGHPYVETPNIDALRAQGAWIENCFVTTSICCPSRATFLTGCYASRHGVIDNETAEYDPAVTPPVSGYLQTAGYRTAMIGKWHMGYSGRPRPSFDHWISFDGQGVYNDPVLNINGAKEKREGYTTDLLTQSAIDFIDDQPLDRPYFLMLSHKAVHEPFQPAERHEKAFGHDRGLPEPASWSDDFQGKPKWQRRERAYDARWHYRTRDREQERIPASVTAAPWDPKQRYVDQLRCLSAVDDGVGRLISKLKERGTLDNTVIVFTSDNGYFHLEHRRWDKRLAYDESIRIPMIIAYPGVVAAGSTIEGLCTNADLAPTLLDLAGLDVPEAMQGDSMAPLFSADTPAWREHVFYEYWTELVHAIPTMVAVRTEKMKLVHYPTSDDIAELYDVSSDPAELTNLIDNPTYAAERSRLEKLLLRSQEQVGWKPRIFPKNLPRMRGDARVLVDLQSTDGQLIDTAHSRAQAALTQGPRDPWNLDGSLSPLLLDYEQQRDPSSWPFEVDISFRVAGDGVLLSTSGPDTGFSVFVQDGRPAVSARVKTWVTTTTTIDGPRLPKGAWADVVARVDFNQLSLRVNGKLIETVALPLPLKRPTMQPLVVGAPSATPASRDTPTTPFVGQVRRYRILRPEVEEAASPLTTSSAGNSPQVSLLP